MNIFKHFFASFLGRGPKPDDHGYSEECSNVGIKFSHDHKYQWPDSCTLIHPQRHEGEQFSNHIPLQSVESIESELLFPFQHDTLPGREEFFEAYSDLTGPSSSDWGQLNVISENVRVSSEMTCNTLNGCRYFGMQSQRILVGECGSYYEGEVKRGKMWGHGTLISKDGSQFVAGEWRKNKLVILNECQFVNKGITNHTVYLRKKTDHHLLSIDEEPYLVRVVMKSVFGLGFLTQSFDCIKRSLFDQLTIIDVIVDTLQSETKDVSNELFRLLSMALKESVDVSQKTSLLLLFGKYAKENSDQNILNSMLGEEFLPTNIKHFARRLLACEDYLCDRQMCYIRYSRNVEPPRYSLMRTIQEIFYANVENLRQSLIRSCPPSLPTLASALSSLPNDKILLVTEADIGLFHHLASLTDVPLYLCFIESLVNAFLIQLRHIPVENQIGSYVAPLINPVYSFLFKSFLDIVKEICNQVSDCTLQNMLQFHQENWTLIERIDWPLQSESGCLYQTSLESQYRFIFKLLKHFTPGNNTGEEFNYTFHIMFQNGICNNGNLWKKQLGFLLFALKILNDPTDLPEDRLIWLYLLDNTVATMSILLSSQNENSERCIKLLEPLMNSHMNFILTAESGSYETLRVVTHTIISFIAQTAPYFLKSRIHIQEDLLILEKQVNHVTKLSCNLNCGVFAIDNFRDLIIECNRYWNSRELLTVSDDSGNIMAANILVAESNLCENILKFVSMSLDKVVPVKTLVGYFRSLNEFLIDFKEMDFLSHWYIKSSSYCPQVLEKVTNKLTMEALCSYRVINVEAYVELCQGDIAPHFLLLIMHELVDCARILLIKDWAKSDNQDVDQVDGVSLLLDAMRSSFLYLKEQPDYRDFQLFKNESVEPFTRVVKNCHTLEDFRRRINIVKDSFWYIRKVDEIGIDRALEMFRSVNPDTVSISKLEDCYELYLSELHNLLDHAKSVNHEEELNIAVAYVRKITDCSQFNVKEWDEDFKNKKIPMILAGLSGVWSLIVSNDVASSGKLLKPHCIQILCIMRLLGIDEGIAGVENHIAQVLTGQGKSLILGLLAALLALTGHQVRVVCYSHFLASRDQKDFYNFFEVLGVGGRINYGTFDDMAEELMEPKIGNKNISLRQLVENLILNHSKWANVGYSAPDTSNAILLIDEVDVFFSDEFYGNTYRPTTTLTIRDLTRIQEKLWGLVKNRKYTLLDESVVLMLIRKELQSSNCKDLKVFQSTRGKISILANKNGAVVEEIYTNETLFQQHLELMVRNALSVANGHASDWFINRFEINKNGVISYQVRNGKYDPYTICGYYSTFNYLRLKRNGYNHKNYQNYGYLNIVTGMISYAQLPKEYPVILGVSGTVSNLFPYEKEAMSDSYCIETFSILPSYFGQSNLVFNRVSNFNVFVSEEEWCNAIYSQAETAITCHRGVLIFFYSMTELGFFSSKYQNKFDRLNILTINTDQYLKHVYIEEAGVACTVTLVTREMGRGVDYKSSVSVEKAGGVHVIQTFFSVDPKEETQIKGRTARKDNKGSYELILCKEHLLRERLCDISDSSKVTYAQLNKARNQIMKKKGDEYAVNIALSEKNHLKTMEYFGLSRKQ